MYIYKMLDSKSGTNEHPTRPFELRICGIFSWPSPPGFFAFKPCNYGLQEQLISKKAPQKKAPTTIAAKKGRPTKTCSGDRTIVKPETIPYVCLAHQTPQKQEAGY